MRAVATSMDQHADQLTQLDAAIGDADHGHNMRRGFGMVVPALAGHRCATVGEVLVKTGSTLITSMGGAAGPLYGSAFRAAGKKLNTPDATPEAFLMSWYAALTAIRQLGGASPGDKTMVDAFAAGVNAFEEATWRGADLAAAAAKAAAAANAGARSTIPLHARKGRASYLGARSVGHQDPGATSTALIFRALADVAAMPRR
ncbi:dihydroxyacetone kinase subunit DhaL [Lentzea tibetensis]|uniref:dihydroxyacetone kinase subunit DhaL n=1 Tax=Lentzea tibetensis TaxID=2591470 RepID=UPI001F3DDA73|nr:dihydroxyacetone kinase subunit DhaL [Lentzea tibetensis]